MLQIGDSHTASDQLTGRLRALLQRQFGNGGRGFLPPGVPHDYYRPQLVGVAQTGGWRLLTSNKAQPDAAQYGLAGIVMRAPAASKASMVVEDRAGTETAWLEVHFLPRPDGGSLEALVDGEVYGRFDTRANSPALVKTEGRGRRIELRAVGDGPVDLAALRHVAHDAGVVLSNIGFIGAQLSIMDRWHWPSVRADIAALDPALIILAFGTNEGFGSAARMEAGYARELDERLAALKQAAPAAAIVVVGAPDANRYPRFCLPAPKVVWDKLPEKNGQPPPAQPTPQPQPTPGKPESEGPAAGAPAPRDTAAPAETAGARGQGPRVEAPADPYAITPPTGYPPVSPQPGDARKAEPALPAADAKPGYRRRLVYPDPPADAQCKPLEPEERQRYDALLEAKDRRLCRWHTPAAIPVVRRIQQEVAERHGVLFFDWSALFDGECGADVWTRRGLAHKDRVHFKAEGYALAADRLHAALLAGYVRAR